MKYKAELIPPALVIARYFAAEQAAIEKLEAEVAAIEQQMEEMAEEHGGEEGLLADAKNDKDKLTKAIGRGAAEGDQGRRRRGGRAQGAERLPRPRPRRKPPPARSSRTRRTR